MARIVVAGAGVAGMCGAMMLARDGHQVVVLERDAAPPVEPDLAWDRWTRPGVTQFKLPHALSHGSGRCWTRSCRMPCPRWRLPGALRSNRITVLPPSMTGGVRPGRPAVRHDHRSPAADRSRDGGDVGRPGRGHRAPRGRRAAARHRRCARAATTGLSGSRASSPMAVSASMPTSWSTPAGGARRCRSCSRWRAPRLPSRTWPTAGTSAPPAASAAPDGSMPPMFGPPLHTYTSLQTATLPADHGWWSVVVVASARDHALHRLVDPDVWQRLIASYPLIAPWVDASR